MEENERERLRSEADAATSRVRLRGGKDEAPVGAATGAP